MIIYGKNPVFEAVKAGKARKVYIRKGAALYDIKFPIPVQVMHKNEFDSRFHIEAQGVAAEVEDIQPLSFEDAYESLTTGASGVVILDRIQDPHNFGAIIRSACCFGVSHIVVPRYHQAPISPAVCKASAGAIFYVTIIMETNLAAVCEKLKSIGYMVVACDMDGDAVIGSLPPAAKSAVIVGSEGKGLRRSLSASADIVAGIPITGEVGSLNAAQSAAIALYEIFGKKLR